MHSFFPEGSYPLHDPFAQRFLTQLRRRAAAWATDVTPAETLTETMVNPVVVSVSVPGVTGTRTTLWVVCQHPADRLPSLTGWWGRAGYVDEEVDPVRGLSVAGLPLTPEDLADLAAQWMEMHLLMDIYRDDWNRGRPSRRDLYGTAPPFRQGRRTRVSSVLERAAGHAKPPVTE